MKQRLKTIEKRTKFTTNTYMKEAENYTALVINDNDDYYITIKKYNKVSSPFVLVNKDNEKINYIENGSYVVEFTPKKDFYNIRFYVTKDYELLDFYVDISLRNGEKYKIPYYVDLYLDIINYPKEKRVAFIDEDELLEALQQKKISQKDYNFAYKVGNRVLEEIRLGKNQFINMDVISLIKKNILL